MSRAIEKRTPCLFLFDGHAEGVPEPALQACTGFLLKAVSTADPGGELVAELRGGLSTLSGFATQIIKVSSAPGRYGHTQAHDMALFRLLLWDMAEALAEGAGAPSSLPILNVLRKGSEECLTLSDMPEQMREICKEQLRDTPGFVGLFPIDPGNPI